MASRRPSGRKSNYPTPQQWEAVRPIVYDLYIVQNLRCEDVSRIMSEKYGFEATDRMFKSRYRTWHFEGKKQKREIYLAMREVYQHRKCQHGSETFFEMPQGQKKIPRSIDQILKEVNRKGRQEPMDLETAYQTLTENHVDILDRPGPCSTLNMPPLTFHRRSLGSPAADESSGEEFSDVSDGDESPMMETALSISSPMRSHLGRSTPASTHTLPTLPKLQTQFGVWEYFATAHTPHFTAETLPYDFFATFEKLSMESLHLTAGDRLAPEFAHQDQIILPLLTQPQQKLATGEWAAPFYLAWDKERDPLNLDLCKTRAMNIFRRMLKSESDNQFILPCLSWMVIVLGCNGHDEHLKDFLAMSCNVIDEEEDQGWKYGGLFHYALAACKGDESAMESYGQNLERDYYHIQSVFSEDSPNALVSLYYWSWHLLSKKEYNTVIQLLGNYLPISERVMGPRDLLTLNCIVILCRAYEEAGELEIATSGLKDAENRLGEPKKPMRAFQVTILNRLSHCLLAQNKPALAEPYLRLVYEGRIELLGWKSDTIGALEALCNAIAQQGRTEEARRVYDEANQRYATDWERSMGI